jgi:hypothetical protein
MTLNSQYNPYERPSPYEVLGLREGRGTSVEDVGRAYNEQKRKARLIKDTKERAARQAELDRARDRLLRPDDRVLVDFFALGDDLLPELCCRYAEQMRHEGLPAAELIAGLHEGRPHDDLVPEDPDEAAGELPPLGAPAFHNHPDAIPQPGRDQA